MTSEHLTRGQRQFLARKGIRGREWDNMKPSEQEEWLEEMKLGAYDRSDRISGTQNNKFIY